MGVAPAFAIVYLIGGYLRSLWMGGRGKGMYGGKKKRAGVWVAMRRVSFPHQISNDKFKIELMMIAIQEDRTSSHLPTKP